MPHSEPLAGLLDYHAHLPPYRLLLLPNARYDYQTHLFVPISQNELNSMRNANAAHSDKTSKIKMKYKLLLLDVSRRTLLLSMRINGSHAEVLPLQTHLKQKDAFRFPVSFGLLPIEIQVHIFGLVDLKESYLACMHTSKSFYQLAKPWLYERVVFTSTYRFAQFVTYLRLNADVGRYVREVDLSAIKPGNYEAELDGSDDENSHLEEDTFHVHHNDTHPSRIRAGWREWKFKSNPLYSVHMPSSTNLTKIASNSQISAKSLKSHSLYTSKTVGLGSVHRLLKYLRYFRPRRRPRADLEPAPSVPKAPTAALHDQPPARAPHPAVNRFLLGYALSKDVPVGYILHLINLCPHVTLLNLGGLSLSIDYEITKAQMYKYQTFDLMNNYPSDMVRQIDAAMSSGPSDSMDRDSFRSFRMAPPSFGAEIPRLKHEHDLSSSASLVFSITTFSKPIRKYNSLLPPLPPTVLDISYMSKGDLRVYLSDLNLKSINNAFLTKLNERELLTNIVRLHSNKFFMGDHLRYLNLSLLIWLNKRLVHEFMYQFLNPAMYVSGGHDTDSVSSLATEMSDEWHDGIGQELVIDLTDSGMYKNLEWATLIDLTTRSGQKIARRLVNDDSFDVVENYLRRERVRRGRIGENYLS